MNTVMSKNFGWRMGNQLFQIAAAAGAADRFEDYTFSVPEGWKYKDMFENEFDLKNHNVTPNYIFKEDGFHHQEPPTPPGNGIYHMDGYFQSDKYFNHCEEKIKSMFSIKKEIKDALMEKHKDLLSQDNICAIHLRRGDYLQYPDHHPVMGMNYFMKAVKKYPKDTKFLVFSDDTEWCKNNFPAIGEKFFVIEDQTEIEDFVMQTMCKNNIIANSSYSWWAAWLNDNPDKIVVAPTKWFGPAYAHYDTKDIYPETWIKI